MNCGKAIRVGRWRLSTPSRCSHSSPLAPQEFENPEGEDCSGEYTPPAEETSSSQSLPDVYILPLAEVSLPVPAPQPAHSGTARPPQHPAVPALRASFRGSGRVEGSNL